MGIDIQKIKQGFRGMGAYVGSKIDHFQQWRNGTREARMILSWKNFLGRIARKDTPMGLSPQEGEKGPLSLRERRRALSRQRRRVSVGETIRQIEKNVLETHLHNPDLDVEARREKELALKLLEKYHLFYNFSLKEDRFTSGPDEVLKLYNDFGKAVDKGLLGAGTSHQNFISIIQRLEDIRKLGGKLIPKNGSCRLEGEIALSKEDLGKMYDGEFLKMWEDIPLLRCVSKGQEPLRDIPIHPSFKSDSHRITWKIGDIEIKPQEGGEDVEIHRLVAMDHYFEGLKLEEGTRRNLLHLLSIVTMQGSEAGIAQKTGIFIKGNSHVTIGQEGDKIHISITRTGTLGIGEEIGLWQTHQLATSEVHFTINLHQLKTIPDPASPTLGVGEETNELPKDLISDIRYHVRFKPPLPQAPRPAKPPLLPHSISS